MGFDEILKLMRFGPTDAQLAGLAQIGDPSMAANIPGMGGGTGLVAQPGADFGAALQQPTPSQGFQMPQQGVPPGGQGFQAKPNSAQIMGTAPQRFDPAQLMALLGSGGMMQQPQQQQAPQAGAVRVGSSPQVNLQSLLPVGGNPQIARLTLGDVLRGQ